MRRNSVMLAAPVLALSLLAGCGGANTTADKQPSTGPSSSKPATSPSTSPGQPGGGSPDAADTKYCALIGGGLSSLFGNVTSPKDIARATVVSKKVAAAAPSAIHDDWNVLSGVINDTSVALTKAAELQQQAKSGKLSKKQLRERMASLEQQTKGLRTSRTVAAGQAIDKYTTAHCGTLSAK